jgi:death-on-curing family protein
MPKKRLRVRDLSKEVRLSSDEILLRLWSEGIDYVNGPSDSIRKGDFNRARQALGLPTRHERTSVAYWRKALELAPLELSRLLAQKGFQVDEGKLTLPKGAVRKLIAERQSRLLKGTVKPTPRGAVENRKIPPRFVWYQVGHEVDLRMLTYEDVLEIHNSLVQDFTDDEDPIEPPGVRNETLLQSAVTRPHTRIGSDRKYRTVEMAAAALLHSLVMDHPFHNGNKRTALVAMLVFLDENGFLLTCDQEQLFKLVLLVAQHSIVDSHPKDLSDREVLAIAEWIRNHCRVVEKGDLPIPFHTLRRILTAFNCQITSVPGSCVNINRVVQGPTSFRSQPRDIELTMQVAYDGEGREVSKGTLGKIRAALHLDDEHNVDSKAFYRKEPLSADDFIVRYRKTLRRLAKL